MASSSSRGRTPAEQTEENPLLPEEMCERNAERHEWRADVLAFIRDHIESEEMYRLGEADLEFAELLPEEPWSVTQEEFEERARVGLGLSRLANGIRPFGPTALAADFRHPDDN